MRRSWKVIEKWAARSWSRKLAGKMEAWSRKRRIIRLASVALVVSKIWQRSNLLWVSLWKIVKMFTVMSVNLHKLDHSTIIWIIEVGWNRCNWSMTSWTRAIFLVNGTKLLRIISPDLLCLLFENLGKSAPLSWSEGLKQRNFSSKVLFSVDVERALVVRRFYVEMS